MRTFNIVINDKTYKTKAINEDYIVEGWKNRIKIMDGYFLEYDLQGWQFDFSTNVDINIIAVTLQDRKTILFNENSLYLLPWHIIKYTILHEICHALTPDDKGHGKQWEYQCELLQIPASAKLIRNYHIENDYVIYDEIQPLLPHDFNMSRKSKQYIM